MLSMIDYSLIPISNLPDDATNTSFQAIHEVARPVVALHQATISAQSTLSRQQLYA
jgi:hypothetical protein